MSQEEVLELSANSGLSTGCNHTGMTKAISYLYCSLKSSQYSGASLLSGMHGVLNVPKCLCMRLHLSRNRRSL